MKSILLVFGRFLAEVRHDAMLIFMPVVSLLMGTAFRFGLPLLEQALCHRFGCPALLTPYFLLFDLLLALMTPLLFSYCAVMVLLEEIDTGLCAYLRVTPAGTFGYLMARVVLPAAAAALYNTAVLAIFSLTRQPIWMLLALSALSALLSILISLLVVSFAANKVEGMALIKLSGLLILGLPGCFFLKGPTRWICGILPSFWFGELARTQSAFFLLPTLGVSFLWLVFLYRRFCRRIG